jgi:hypothetical protein
MKDLLHRYWGEMICEMALQVALQAIHRHHRGNFPSRADFPLWHRVRYPDWPIEEQRPAVQASLATPGAI